MTGLNGLNLEVLTKFLWNFWRLNGANTMWCSAPIGTLPEKPVLGEMRSPPFVMEESRYGGLARRIISYNGIAVWGMNSFCKDYRPEDLTADEWSMLADGLAGFRRKIRASAPEGWILETRSVRDPEIPELSYDVTTEGNVRNFKSTEQILWIPPEGGEVSCAHTARISVCEYHGGLLFPEQNLR